MFWGTQCNKHFQLENCQVSFLEIVLQPMYLTKEISNQILEEMSEDSEKEDYSDRTISDEDESVCFSHLYPT